MPALEVSEEAITKVGKELRDVSRPLKDRFRALFTLKNINTNKCIEEIAKGFSGTSALLKHELAYCLGQMQNTAAIPILIDVLEDEQQETIVRHEAGEALGAIGALEVLPLLDRYSKHSIPEIAETCQLAVERIEWLKQNNAENFSSGNQFGSVDPAPPILETKSLEELTNILLNEDKSLFERYRAMFSLRNKGGEGEVRALSQGLKCKSALFRHEIAFVLGQMSHPAATEALREVLMNQEEHGMVRHECAEALGSIATEDCMKLLENYLQDKERVVRESCDIALDMCEYENSEQFQYADGLSK